MALTDSSTRSGLAFPAAVLARAVRRVELFLRRLEGRQQVLRLGEMSDRELADIGIRRGDLHEAWHLGLRGDATHHLATIARPGASSRPGRRSA